MLLCGCQDGLQAVWLLGGCDGYKEVQIVFCCIAVWLLGWLLRGSGCMLVLLGGC